jgi:hypothetical protein
MQRLLDQINSDDARGFFQHCNCKLQEE